MIKDFTTYINEGLFDRNQSEFAVRKTDKGIEQVYIPKTKKELYEYIEIDIEQAKKEGTYPNVNLNNIDVSELGNIDELKGLFGDVYKQINPDISNWDIKYIPNYFFYGNEQIKEFTIPNSVTSIGDGAFMGCTGLTSVTIHNRVTIIGYDAFRDCSSLTYVTIGNSVTRIEYGAFGSCSSLTSVEIPNSVTYIGGSAFKGCSSLKSVTIPDGVTTINDFAFANCSSLKSVTIPDSVTVMGYDAFHYCLGLTDINIEANNPNYCSVEGVLFSKDKMTLILYPAGRQGTYTIPNGVEVIGNSSFEWCSSLTSVTIPDSVTYIGWDAFSHCDSLKSVTIPDGVTNIRYGAFYYCNGLKSVTISKHCRIENNSFPKNCKIIRK